MVRTLLPPVPTPLHAADAAGVFRLLALRLPV
eukprot:CAMPEP_0178658438 /NCGR_PEP_ID=MMETSP0698-20121128/25981_1 /TAXON_ID=265572 /ORGANISM="Extubocellulus spinifer, Strain CCMP396" /LENGTH=31 /DNA_ID= /DNA_START= /DNA_END= /DNA_ORIENTATION=